MALLAFESAVESEFSLADCTFIFTQKRLRVYREKNLFNEDIVRLTLTSVKGRHSIDIDMNVESSYYGYFPQTETVFVVQFSRVGG